MFIRVSLVLALTLAVMPAQPQAQTSGAVSTKHLSVTSSATVSRTGDRVSLVLDVVPNPGIHVYAPGARDYRIVEVDVQPTDVGAVARTRYPASELYTFT